MRTHKGRILCLSFTKAYPIRNGTASITSYHVVFVPKRRRKAILGQTRRQLGQIFHALAKQKECQIVEGRLMSDLVHMGIAIEPKHPVASVIGFLKGKSAIAIARLCGKGGILRMSISGPAAIGAGPPIHPRAGPRGWNKRAFLSRYQRRA